MSLFSKKVACVSCNQPTPGPAPAACRNCISLAPCSAGVRNELKLAGLPVPPMISHRR